MINVYKTKKMRPYLQDEVYNPNFKNHNLHILKHYVICGGTGTGKSNFIINYLAKLSNVFEHIYIFTKDITEEIYQMLQDEVGKDYISIESIDNVVPLDKIKKYKQALILFDDFICCDKKVMNILETYAIMARKKGFTCIYLTQSYFACPIKIRQQMRYIVLLALTNKLNLDMIISNLSIDVENKTIKKIIKNATKNNLCVCIIDLQSNKEMNKIFRRNFEDFYKIVDENGDELETIQYYHDKGLLN